MVFVWGHYTFVSMQIQTQFLDGSAIWKGVGHYTHFKKVGRGHMPLALPMFQNIHCACAFTTLAN